jgi:hypothetical protein
MSRIAIKKNIVTMTEEHHKLCFNFRTDDEVNLRERDFFNRITALDLAPQYDPMMQAMKTQLNDIKANLNHLPAVDLEILRRKLFQDTLNDINQRASDPLISAHEIESLKKFKEQLAVEIQAIEQHMLSEAARIQALEHLVKEKFLNPKQASNAATLGDGQSFFKQKLNHLHNQMGGFLSSSLLKEAISGQGYSVQLEKEDDESLLEKARALVIAQMASGKLTIELTFHANEYCKQPQLNRVFKLMVQAAAEQGVDFNHLKINITKTIEGKTLPGEYETFQGKDGIQSRFTSAAMMKECSALDSIREEALLTVFGESSPP